MNDDLAIVNNARGSLDVETDWTMGWRCLVCGIEWRSGDGNFCIEHQEWASKRMLSEKDEGLLRSLARNRHGTPFEVVYFHFHVDTNIRVSREWFRHRIGSFNEMSTRYMKMDKFGAADCFMPEGDAIRSDVGKAMSYVKEPITDPNVVKDITAEMDYAYDTAMSVYKDLLKQGVSREVAAYVLPLGFKTAFYWTVNLRSIFNFLNLRNAPTALLEIRQEAVQVEKIVKQIVPIAYDEWNKNGRLPI